MDGKALHLDILVTGALKYLLGSPGVAFMYMRRELVERFEPSDSGWFGQENVFAYDVHHLRYAASARRFQNRCARRAPVLRRPGGRRLSVEAGVPTNHAPRHARRQRFSYGARPD